ncbi:MAG: ATP-dependent DNA helicase PcrA [Candidatus Scalindua sp. AMX11]|nr:MAG: ATP-dependent DNA helicase PcrA [Candidatus Scalindua sp.]NOG84786.1 UvrD-helicase domain-containing protein [Planctomycetota bacterium]RZV98387.1 MAG: ATP-dependent DNA helicase PcrA [Candidatus Scalindua sp. SCAELEC01]TDE66517.1 MAG: ATP-dependent DNA helicase PcrA [Candidatus Scalindua sp. AMX11]GJQ58880.1 MAG: ATP-dependent DNA helicase PcrA [Candidatus Scalindua sp.]
MNILDNVTESQKEAITHIDGPLLVIAGAGSGKTRVITRRIGYLIENRISPYNILAITFTNKAANEMKERLNTFLDQKGVWVSTFHTMCARILRSEIELLGYSNHFTIYDTSDQVRCVKSVMNELNLDTTNWRPSSIVGAISNAKSELLSPEKFSEYNSGYYNAIVAKVYAGYQKSLEANNALDFDDLLFKVAQLFKEQPQVLEKYQEKFRYILIDEYQDTNNAQYTITRLLSQRYKNICATGDPDQSIYGWRGANIQNILNFEKDYPDAKLIHLEQNYRSTKVILGVASELIKNNVSRKPKSLWTENSEGNRVKIIHCDDEYVESNEIASYISEFAKGSDRYSDMAIFYRTNAQSRVLETNLRQKGIPYTIVGSVEFFKRKEIKDVLSYLKLCANVTDDMSFERVVNTPPRGIGQTTLKRLRGWALANNLRLLQAGLRVQEVPEIRTRSARAVMGFCDIISTLCKFPTYPVMELVKQVIDRVGFREYLTQAYDHDSKERLENIEELINAANEYDISNTEGSLEGFLEGVSLISDIDKWDESEETVTLMTLHAAKGLEFPIVFMAGFEEGLLPHSQSKDSDDDVEEERRLCYVGITRAQRELFLTHARYRSKFGQRSIGIPSRFLSEIPEELTESIDKTQYGSGLDDFQAGDAQGDREFLSSRDKWFQNIRKGEETVTFGTPDLTPSKSNNFLPGDMVRHGRFGRGKVTRISPSSDAAFVDFNRVGTKKLILKYAKLEKE